MGETGEQDGGRDRTSRTATARSPAHGSGAPEQAELPPFEPERESASALHAQIEEWLSELIESGRLKTDARLPNERALAQQLQISRMTLRQALQTLESRGLIRRAPGRHGGAFIAAPPIAVDLTGLPGLALQIQQSDHRPGSLVRTARTQPAGHRAAAALGLNADDQVCFVDRIRLADEQPVAIERSSFPAALLPGFLEQDLEGSLYKVLSGYGLAPATAEEQLVPVLAGSDADALGVSASRPLLLRIRVARAKDGTPVEYSRDLFRTDRARVVVTSRLTEA
ncbi:GntR family transcriptional regulator [Sediminivirga luteola]|uniref:GntR family transcriptional regulator n=1 Tax=Sediminivirga luteola TaxID=1774748 RepID=UPI001F58008B|nr:GntR family transcriptional regulator [Sediminivirga luteola]MCI2265019.1 GntR family transcriptional regulator [Sediminivirga luteola]